MRHPALTVSSLIAIALMGCDGSTTGPAIDSIVIRQGADTIETGQTDSLSASLHAGTTEIPNDPALRWTSSNPEVFGIDSLTGVGEARAVAAPQVVTITATYRTLQTQRPIVVLPPIVGLRVLVSTTVALGHAITPVAGILGDPQFGVYTEADASWGTRFESANPAVLQANANGTLAAVGLGTTRVTAIVHGKRESTDVAVINGYPMSVIAGTEVFGVIDVNDNGEVVGNRGSPSSVLLHNGEQVVLGTCAARGINNQSQVLCGSSVYANGQLTDVFGSGAFAGTSTGINESGDVFGLLMSPDSLRNRAFVWRAGSIELLANPVDGVALQSTTHVNISDHGLGQSNTVATFPVLLRVEGYTYLAPPAGRVAVALDINESENVVGSADNPRGSGNAVIWLKNQSFNGAYLGPRTSVATAISERNEVVGLGADGAFVWKDGSYTALADVVAEPGWTFRSAPAVSRNGTVAAYATNADGRKGVVLVRLP